MTALARFGGFAVAVFAATTAALALMARTLSWKRLRRRQQAEEQPA